MVGIPDSGLYPPIFSGLVMTTFSCHAEEPNIVPQKTYSVILEDNTIYHNNRVGLRVRGTTPVLVNNSSIFQNGRSGLNLEQNAHVKINNSNIFKNKKAGINSNDVLHIELLNSKVQQNDKGGLRVRKSAQSKSKETNVTLRNNKIFLNKMGGIHSVPIEGGRINLSVVNNKIFKNNRGGIRLENNTWLTAAGNQIYSNGTAGIAAYESEEIPPKLDIYQNKIYFNTGAGIYVHSGTTGNFGISNNWIYNNHRAGISCGLWDNPGDYLLDVDIQHNVIFANGSDEEGAGIRNDSSGDVVIRNNIIAYNFTTGIMTKGCGRSSYNLLFANGETSNFDENSDNDVFLVEKLQYAGCSGRQWGDLLADPLFVNPDIYDFALQENSPARGAGSSPYLFFFQKTDMGTILPPAPLE